MNQQEFSIIVKAIKAVYPSMLQDDGAKDVWFNLLSDLPYTQVSAALQAHMMTSKFPPTIAELRENYNTSEISELEAWAMVRRAIRNGNYGAEEEFEKLPEIVRRAVGAANNLRQWAQSEGMIETIEAHFLKAFRAAQQRQKQENQISPRVRALLQETSQKLIGSSNT